VLYHSNYAQTIGTVGDYFCAYEAKALGTSGWNPHDPLASDWDLLAYQNYDSGTKTYDTELNRNQHCEYGTEKTSYPQYNTIYVKCPGTGISGKDSFFSNYDMYVDPSGINGYMQFAEWGSILYGDRSSFQNQGLVPIYFRWNLICYYWRYYNHSEDLISAINEVGNYCCVDGGRPSTYTQENNNWPNNAHIGHNDEAEDVLIYGAGTPNDLPVPGWPGISAYCYFEGDAEYNSLHNIKGGRYYFHRNAGNWKIVAGGQWTTATSGGTTTLTHFADRWKSIRTIGMFYTSNIINFL
jgi:hypothetical protein